MKQFIHSITLYKLSKVGKTQVFELAVLTDPVQLHTSKGYLDGASQLDIKDFKEGKNIGRANETSPIEQATLELQSKVSKLLDKGYKRSLEELKDSKGTDASGNLKPMLAQHNIKRITFPGFTQRKYDGVRCFSFIFVNTDGLMKVYKYSRNGKLFNHLDHLDIELMQVAEHVSFDGDLIVDGELYSHELSFQSIVSSVKRAQPSNLKINIRVYDIIPRKDMIQYDRMMELRYLRSLIKKHILNISNIEIVKTSIVKDMGKLMKKFQLYIKEGYEGLIWRDFDSEYEFGGRSYSLIKYKEFDEEEFEIVGANEATGRDIGTAIFILKTKDGKEFRARPLGSRELRKEYLENIDEYIGEMGTVKFQGFSDDGIPRFPVFKIVRNYE